MSLFSYQDFSESNDETPSDHGRNGSWGPKEIENLTHVSNLYPVNGDTLGDLARAILYLDAVLRRPAEFWLESEVLGPEMLEHQLLRVVTVRDVLAERLTRALLEKHPELWGIVE